MGKNKLSKFADLESFHNVLQVPYQSLKQAHHPLRGNWNLNFFEKPQPIVLELGCGKGEYTTGLAEIDQGKNYIGIDIKGSRMWSGATYAIQNGLSNVGFLRSQIELIDNFFGPSEVSEIWLTFPDPQMQRWRKRLTSTRFIELYQKFLVTGGIVHLKTDSNFMFQYTLEMAKINGFEIVIQNDNIYEEELTHPALGIKTYYEEQWIARGISIKYVSFIPHQNKLIEPEIYIEPDRYRSFGRDAVIDDQE